MAYAFHRHNDFVEDMQAAMFEVRDYQGRNYYSGPAVVVEKRQLQDVIRATTVRVQWDDMGLGLVVYPKELGHRVRLSN